MRYGIDFTTRPTGFTAGKDSKRLLVVYKAKKREANLRPGRPV